MTEGTTGSKKHAAPYNIRSCKYLLKLRGAQHSVLLLTPWGRFVLDTLISPQPVPAFHGARKFITAFSNAPHLSLSCATEIHSTPHHPTSLRYVLILSSHLRLGLPSVTFPSGLPTKPLYAPLLSPYMPHAPPISLILI